MFFWQVFFKKSVKTAVPEDGNPPGALVLTKLVELYRFGVGDENSCFCVFLCNGGFPCVIFQNMMAKKCKHKVSVGFPAEFLQENWGITPQFPLYTVGGDKPKQPFFLTS